MNLPELETPALVLDRARLERNIARMRDHLARLNVNLRPHVKTSKSIEVARRALEGQRGGITVSTLAEAEYFFGHGVKDILYAVGIAPNKLAHVADLRRRGADVTVILDSAEAAAALGANARQHGVEFPALIEIDSDGHRSGVKPGDPRLVGIVRTLEAGPGTAMRGVMTHAGDSYNCRSREAIGAMAERERAAVVGCAQALARAGLPCPVVSVGSTPTATFAKDLTGVTEVRAGVYMFFDLVMAGLGVCSIDDVAVSVLATVIGHQPDKGWIITDAGWMALSRDRGTARQAVDQGYGLVCDASGRPVEGLIVADTNQEHGIVAHRGGGTIDLAGYPVGTQLRILPNHACATAAQHACYQVVNGSTVIEAVWERIAGW
jgi:D-serine deaminase-like pyridoxal phosphate-dependent protein